MSLKLVRVLDYTARYDFCPPSVESVINLNEVVSAVPCESRHVEPTMIVRFRDGQSLTVIGMPTDLISKLP